MKKNLLALWGVLAIACGGRQQESSWPLCGELEAFTAHVPGDTLTLTGIRHRLTGDTLVAPQHFVSVVADSLVVKATMPNKRLMVYSHRGLCIRGHSFDSFARLVWQAVPTDADGATVPGGAENNRQAESSVYYIGTDYDRSFYYFPVKRRLVEITGARIAGEEFTVPGEHGDSITYDYHGEVVRGGRY